VPLGTDIHGIISAMVELCPQCGKNLALVGRVHNCNPIAGTHCAGVVVPAGPPVATKPDGVVKVTKPDLEPLKTAIAEAEKRGRGRPKSEHPGPWVGTGLSRRTFFRRKKAAKS